MSNFAEDFGKLLVEATVTDTIHDVTFQVGAKIFPVHKYILAMRSDFFRKLFISDHDWLDPPDLYRKEEDDVGCDLFVIEKLHPDLFTYLLQYIYTDTCDLLIYGHVPQMIYKEKTDEYQDILISNFSKISVHEDVNKKSAFEVNRSNQALLVNETQKSKPKSAAKKCKAVGEEVNLIKMLQIAAKKFGLGSLSSRYAVDCVCVFFQCIFVSRCFVPVSPSHHEKDLYLVLCLQKGPLLPYSLPGAWNRSNLFGRKFLERQRTWDPS